MEDADGISSAALIKQAFGGDTILVDYPGMTDVLETLRNDEKLKMLFICDLGLNKQNSDYFVDLLTELRKKTSFYNLCRSSLRRFKNYC